MWERWKRRLEPGPEPENTGSTGEAVAEQFLRKEKGFKILERNWRDGREELDLIALEGDILVFVEVKTRRSGGLVPGFYAVDKRKKRALKRAARAYMRTLRKRPTTFRLDVVEVNHHPLQGWEPLHFSNIDWT